MTGSTDFEVLTRLIGPIEDRDGFERDEHRRYKVYTDAFAVVSPEDERTLLSIVRADPDGSMRESAIAGYVERVARTESLSGFRGWLEAVEDLIDPSTFAGRRGKEWLLLKESESGRPVRESEIEAASDWLQRKMSEVSTLRQPLQLLASNGRTKRIRNVARHRLDELSRVGDNGKS